MSGIMVFESLEAAQRAGFELFDRNADGYLVRIRVLTGFALAIVPFKSRRLR